MCMYVCLSDKVVRVYTYIYMLPPPAYLQLLSFLRPCVVQSNVKSNKKQDLVCIPHMHVYVYPHVDICICVYSKYTCIAPRDNQLPCSQVSYLQGNEETP